MDPISLLLLSLGLSLDALAVSVATACGLGARFRPTDILRMAFAFGFFQAAMPVAGWLLGDAARDMIASYDHWVAFGLLAIIGGRMVVEGFENRGKECVARPLSGWLLLGLAVATSIDALVAGLGISLVGTPIAVPALVIGTTTFLLCAGGALLAVHVERWLRGNAEIAGGLFLVAIGVRVLVEHLG